MTLIKITRIVYGLLGVLYVVIGVGAMLMPTAWFPPDRAAKLLIGTAMNPFIAHVLQEFGTVLIALGFVFLWCAIRREYSARLHWALTFYFLLDALIHWVGPEGLIGSWSRGIINSTPFVVMLVLGLLHRRADEGMRQSLAAGIPGG